MKSSLRIWTAWTGSNPSSYPKHLTSGEDPLDPELFLGKDEIRSDVERIYGFIKRCNIRLGRKGAVVGLSGGIDSALTASICVNALGRESVLGVILPEKESNPISRDLALEHVARLGIESIEVDVTPVLESLGSYELREKAVRSIVGDLPEGSKWNITLPGDLNSSSSMNVYSLNVRTPEGVSIRKRLVPSVMREIMASTNTKQRIRMLLLYFHAELRDYMVVGTTNRTEMLLGYYLKYGDGGVDIEPISHLFKTEVYLMASLYDIPEGIVNRIPSPDTFSEPVSDSDFFFRLKYSELDFFLAGWEKEIPPQELSRMSGKDISIVLRILDEINKRYELSGHLREQPYSLIR